MFWLLLAVCTLAEVQILTTSDFDETVKDADPWFVGFFAPWCGHCKKFKPVFKEASEDPRISHVNFGQVDATVEKSLANRFDVHSFPTILFIQGGNQYRFRQSRTLEGVVEYLQQLTQAPVLEASEFLTPSRFEVIYALVNPTDASKTLLDSVAKSYLDKSYLRFFVSNRPDFVPVASPNSSGETHILRLEANTEPQVLNEIENLGDFVEGSQFPLVRAVRDYTQFRPIVKLTTYFLMLVLPSDADEAMYFDALHQLASTADRASYGFGMVHYKDLKHLLVETLKITEDQTPVLVAYHDSSASFVVQAVNTTEQGLGGAQLLRTIDAGEAEWVHALPMTQRVSRYIRMRMDEYGTVGQIVFAVVLFVFFLGGCFLLDQYCFGDYPEINIPTPEAPPETKKDK